MMVFNLKKSGDLVIATVLPSPQYMLPADRNLLKPVYWVKCAIYDAVHRALGPAGVLHITTQSTIGCVLTL